MPFTLAGATGAFFPPITVCIRTFFKQRLHEQQPLAAAYSLAMAPALIMQSMLVAGNSRPEHSTEALTWSSTGLLAGVGAGLTIGGGLLEHAKSPVVFTTAALVSIAAGLLALLLVRTR